LLCKHGGLGSLLAFTEQIDGRLLRERPSRDITLRPEYVLTEVSTLKSHPRSCLHSPAPQHAGRHDVVGGLIHE